MEEKYELWRLKTPEGEYSYHLLPVGRLHPEMRKLGTSVPIPPEMEKALQEMPEEERKKFYL